jgi:predicted nucleic acid-binding Zn ribbon protein
MTCGSCGATIPDNALTCAACGAPVPATSRRKSSLPPPATLIMILVVVGLVGVALAFWLTQ